MKVRIERCWVVVDPVRVASGRVGLPDLYESVGNSPAVGVEHATRDDDPLAERLTRVAGCQVGVGRGDPLGAEQRAGDLSEALWEGNKWLLRCAQGRRLIRRRVERRMYPRDRVVMGQREPPAVCCTAVRTVSGRGVPGFHIAVPPAIGAVAATGSPASSCRNSVSSAAVGGASSPRSGETARSQLVRSRTCSTETPG